MHYCISQARKVISDFGPAIALFVTIMIDLYIGDGVYTQKLHVPVAFSPTSPQKRGWFINPTGHAKSLPVYHMFSAIIPALFVSALIYLGTLIVR